MCFLARWHLCSSGRGSVLGALGPAARRDPAGTPGRKCGPYATSVARALGVQNRTSRRGGIPNP